MVVLIQPSNGSPCHEILQSGSSFSVPESGFWQEFSHLSLSNETVHFCEKPVIMSSYEKMKPLGTNLAVHNTGRL